MLEPCCSFPLTVTCLFSDSGPDRCRGTRNVFASLKRDFRAQWKCVCTVSAFISWEGEEGGREGRKRRRGGRDPGVASSVLGIQPGQERDHPEAAFDLARAESKS